MSKAKTPKPVTEKFGFVGGNLLQSILDKQPDAITEAERDILRARITYLTKEQIERFEVEDAEEEEAEEEAEEEEEKSRDDELNKMKVKDLKELAKGLKIKVKGLEKKDIVDLILDAEKEKN